jgi:hypothetical protein
VIPVPEGWRVGQALGKSVRVIGRVEQIVVWVARAIWVLLPLAMGPAVAGALEGRSGFVQAVALALLWLGWGAVLVGFLLPTTTSLTVVRATVPLTLVVAAVTWCTGASWPQALVAVTAAVLAVLVTFSADLGRRFAQGTAYGDESRYPLRPPVALLLPVGLAWSLLAAASVAGPLLVAARVWILGTVVTLLAIAGAIALGPRFHALSKRWLVLVPAGVVLHDMVVLAETVMIGRAAVGGLALALSGSQAADVSGPAAGAAVELRFNSLIDLVLAATRGDPGGRKLHTRAVLVRPSRPGAALGDAARRGYPVG